MEIRDRTLGALGRSATAYLVVLAAFVVGAHLGLIPGSDGPQDQPFATYRLALALFAAACAVFLGGWAAGVARLRRSRLQGLIALVAGGLVTGAAFVVAPWILYTNDRYSPGLLWLLLGTPLGLFSYVVGVVRGARASADGERA